MYSTYFNSLSFLVFLKIQSDFLYGWLGIVAFLLVIFINFVGSTRAEQSMAWSSDLLYNSIDKTMEEAYSQFMC